MEPVDDEKFEVMRGCIAEGIKLTILFVVFTFIGIFIKDCLGV